MSFYEIETGLSMILQGVERRPEDHRQMTARLKAKLAELRDSGIEVPADEAEEHEDFLGDSHSAPIRS